MTKFIIPVFALLFSCATFADSKKGHQHHKKAHHHAHAHGAGEVKIAFNNLEGRIEFKVAAESVLGFEYTPKSEKDKGVLSTVVNTFTTDAASMFQFTTDVACVLTADKVEQVSTGKNHSYFVSTYNVACAKSVSGTKLNVDLSKYSKIKNLDVQVLVGTGSVSAKYKGKPISIDFPSEQ